MHLARACQRIDVGARQGRARGVQRLFGLHLKTGALTEYASWKTYGAITGFALDRDNTPLLIAQTGRATRVGRLALNHITASLTFLSANYPPSTGSVLVDPRSYTFVTGNPNALGGLLTPATLEGRTGTIAIQELFK
jgi:hypothetical protein